MLIKDNHKDIEEEEIKVQAGRQVQAQNQVDPKLAPFIQKVQDENI